ncbi:MAG TPA: hypothetical protein VFP68_08910 [Burkholderiaceae bacterium]|nr:hypothetical protein [Burkholderiaceae bacterium]
MSPRSEGRRRLLSWIATTALLLSRAVAAGLEIRAVTGDDSPVTRQALDVLRNRLPGVVSGDIRTLAQRQADAIYLTVGPAALQGALKVELKAAILSLYTSSHSYRQVLASAVPSTSSRRITAIYAEASPEHQLRLISAIFQRRVLVGVLITSSTSHLEPWLQHAARESNLDIQIHMVPPGANVVRELNRLANAHVLLALPDPVIYSPDNVREVLESTYRRGQPMVGFSQGMVRAGVIASAYSSADDIAAQAQELIPAIEAGAVPETGYPIYWRVAVNEQVARSLNIVITDEVRNLGRRPGTRTR